MEKFRSQLHDLVNHLSIDELSLQGWSRDSLLESCLKNKHMEVIKDQQLISLISYQQVDSNTREVLFLVTREGWRHRGEMGYLLDLFLAQQAPGTVWLECREDNLKARDLYAKKGFRETGRRSHYYKDGQNAILYMHTS